jgi:hypothetical protein
MKTQYIKAKPLYYSPILGSTSTTRRDTYTERFDSTSEFEFFKDIKNMLPKKYILERQIKTDIICTGAWTIDFKIVATHTHQNERLIKLLMLCGCDVESNDKIDEIFVEYKGVQDKYFKIKMEGILKYDKWLNKRLIIVAQDPSAFVLEDLHDLKREVKILNSKKFFIEVLKATL